MPKKNTNRAKPRPSFTDDILAGAFPDFIGTTGQFLDGLNQPEPLTDPKAPEYDAAGNRNRIGLTTDPIVRRPSPKRTLRRLGRERAAMEHLTALPKPGEDLVLILTGKWHGFDLVGAVIELAKPATIECLDIATLGFNDTQSRHLGELLDRGAVGAVRFMVSDMFRGMNPNEFGVLVHELESRGQTVAARRNHAKLILFKLSDGTTLAAHGSLNLRRCNSFEQLEISTDPALYQFFRDFITDAISDDLQA